MMIHTKAFNIDKQLISSPPTTTESKNIMVPPKNDETLNAMSFPMKMYSLLEDAEMFGFNDVISWQPGNRSFKVYKVDSFSDTIMKSYFSQTSKFKSFQRQLNLYGFKKVQVGPNKGGYIHKHFQRGQVDQLPMIVRRTSKDMSNASDKRDLSLDAFLGKAGATTENKNKNAIFDMEPPLAVSYPTTAEDLTAFEPSTTFHLKESEVSTFYDFFYPEDPLEKTFIDKVFTEMDNEHEPKKTSMGISSLESDMDFLKSIQFENTDLDNFVAVMEDEESMIQQCPQNADSDSSSSSGSSSSSVTTSSSSSSRYCNDNDDQQMLKDPSDTCFPYKVHLMLESAERERYNHIVSWVRNGTAFKVHQPKAFVQQVLPMFFDSTKYESFRRQLNLYQFVREARGPERGTISHPSFLKGARWMCEEIKRARFEQQQQQQQ